MAITFPLPVASLADRLPIANVVWKLREQQEMTGLGSGQMIAIEVGEAYWTADVSTASMSHDDAEDLQAVFESLDGSIHPFLLYNPKKKAPRLDPLGATLGGATPEIDTLDANNRACKISGLPAGYVLSRGDMLAFDYGSNPVRRALHRVAEPATADGAGLTPLFEVRPHFRPGAAVGLGVTLVKPAAKVKIMPGSLAPEMTSLTTSRLSFSVFQVP